MNLFLIRLAHQTEKMVADNSPTILSVVGVIGTAATAYLAAKASFKAADAIEEAEISEKFLGHEMDNKDKALVVWKLYIPAAGSGALTIASIICSNRISTRRAAAMAAAYTLSERAFADYKDKITEKLGINKEKAARDELAQDKVRNNPPGARDVIITGNGDVMCYDMPVGRYFKSNVETIRRAMNDINQQVNHNGYATLSDFYVVLKMTTTPYSEEVGWTTDEMLDIDFSTALTDDNQPCIVMNYKVVPIRGYK